MEFLQHPDFVLTKAGFHSSEHSSKFTRILIEARCVQDTTLFKSRRNRIGDLYWAIVSSEYDWLIQESGVRPAKGGEQRKTVLYQSFLNGLFPSSVKIETKLPIAEYTVTNEYLFEVPHKIARENRDFTLAAYGISEDVLPNDPTIPQITKKYMSANKTRIHWNSHLRPCCRKNPHGRKARRLNTWILHGQEIIFRFLVSSAMNAGALLYQYLIKKVDISISPASVNLGTIPAGQYHGIKCTLTNQSSQAVSFLGATRYCTREACLCTTNTPDVLEPGKKQQVTISVGANLPGPFKIEACFFNDSPHSPRCPVWIFGIAK